MYCMNLPIFSYHSAYRGGGGYLSICYLCQVPFSPVLVFAEDFLSLPRIVYLLDVSSALPHLQKLLAAQGNLIAAFREHCSGVILQTFSMNLQVGVVISLLIFVLPSCAAFSCFFYSFISFLSNYAFLNILILIQFIFNLMSCQ